MEIVAIVSDPSGTPAQRFAGRPLTQHAVLAARATRQVTRTIVVTADAVLARLAEEADAEVVAPPEASDPVGVLAHVLEDRLQHGGGVPTIAVLLDPRYPFCDSNVIDGAIDHLRCCGADTLFCVTPVATPLWVEDSHGGAQRLAGAAEPSRLSESEALVIVRVGIFNQSQELPAGRTALYRVPALAALRLDADTDWQAAEALHRARTMARAKARLRAVGMLVLDFDGVMTDNRVLVFEDGREAVLCNRSDGLGLERLRATGVPLAVISKEVNPVVAARCRKLKIPCEQGVNDKLAVLQRLAAEANVALANIAFVGNDINDLSCLTAVGVAVAPCDAYPEVLRIASVVTAAPGGFGAVREVCDLIMAAQNELAGETIA